MLDMNEINREIEKLEKENMTYRTCEKLSVLYSVRDASQSNKTAIHERNVVNGYSYADAPKVAESEFLKATEGKGVYSVLKILDAHMDVVKALYPKEYNMVVKKIREV